MIAYRIQQGNHPTEWLLDPATQLSTNWANDEDVRNGISACSTLEDLAAYFAQTGVCLDDHCRIIEMACDWADEDDMDEALGAILVIPTAIVSERPVDDDFYTMVSDAYDRLAA